MAINYHNIDKLFGNSLKFRFKNVRSLKPKLRVYCFGATILRVDKRIAGKLDITVHKQKIIYININ